MGSWEEQPECFAAIGNYLRNMKQHFPKMFKPSLDPIRK
jgi:hypothetical protein